MLSGPSGMRGALLPRVPAFASGIPKAFSLLGALFCAVMLFLKKEGGDFCFSSGCMLFSDFTLFGISLWSFGIAAFLAAAAFPATIRLFLVLDSVFLALMLLGLPCVNCMIAGSIFFAVFFFRAFPFSGRDRLLAFAWLSFLVLNLGTLFGEFGDYRITEEASVRIYFSPSCAACEGALAAFPNAALYPVAENDGDLPIIWAMKDFLDKGETPEKALFLAKKAPQEAPFWLDARLWKNKGRVLSAGGVAPLIVRSGFSLKKHNYIKDFSSGR